MKHFFITLTVVLSLFSFTGCANTSTLDPDDPVTLTLWHVYGEQADSSMNRLVDEFNATKGSETGVIVTVTNVTSTSKITAQLQDAIADKPDAPPMPDLFSAHTNTATDLGTEKLIDWNTLFSEDELKNYVPEFLEDGTMDGKLAVFPVSKSTYALFINGSQFDRFSEDTGVTYDSLSTWEGFFDTAAKYYEWSGGKPFCAFDYLIRHIEFDVMAKGDTVEYTQDGWYNLENQSFHDSWLKFAQPLVQGHIVISDQYSNTQVMTGETLSGIGSTAAITYYNDTVTYPDNTSEPMKLKVLPLPKTGDGEQFMPMTGVGLCAYQTTEQKAEAAAVFVRWLTEGERNLNFVAGTGYMPVNNDAFNTIESYKFQNEGYTSLYESIRIMKNEYTPVVRPSFGGYYDKIDALYETLRQTLPELTQRSKRGEAIETLSEETWDTFLSIQ